jgi:hypothetical protein
LVFVPAAESQVLGPKECFSPLEQWCEDHVCPDYQESVAALERLDSSAICLSAARGTCGELRFTTQVNPAASGITHYFGMDGKIVGVTTSSDAVRPRPCDGGWRHYGSGPFRCTRVVEREYCRNPQANLDARAEIRGRIVDAATGRPLQGAVVVVAWRTELPPNPLHVLFGLAVGGGHGSNQQRVARVQEVFSDGDGRFLIPSWTEAEQVRSGRILASAPVLSAFLPGYEPVWWHEAEPEVFGSMSQPRNKVLRMRPSGKDSIEKVQRFSDFLDRNIEEADDYDASTSSRFRVVVSASQQRAAAAVRPELIRLHQAHSPKKKDQASPQGWPVPGQLERAPAQSAPIGVQAPPR